MAADASVYVPTLKEVKILTGYEGEKPILIDNDVVITVENLITHVAGYVASSSASLPPFADVLLSKVHIRNCRQSEGEVPR